MEDIKQEPAVTNDPVTLDVTNNGLLPDEEREDHEIFKVSEHDVDFRTVSWQRATIIFLKIQFAISLLSMRPLYQP